MIALCQLLSVRGFEPAPKHIKLVRHKDSRFDLEALRRTPWFDVYQQYQSKPVFHGCTQIISFIGEEYPKSRFVGVYDVGTRRAAVDVPRSVDCPYPDLTNPEGYFFPLANRPEFKDLEDRLVILDWGKGALVWHQWYSDRPAIEIRPPAVRCRLPGLPPGASDIRGPPAPCRPARSPPRLGRRSVGRWGRYLIIDSLIQYASNILAVLAGQGATHARRDDVPVVEGEALTRDRKGAL